MKKIIIVLLLVLVSNEYLSAQFLYLDEVKLESKEDFVEYSETVADCCNYLLLTPYDKKDEQRISASTFVTQWVTNNPDVEFVVGKKIMVLTEEKQELISIYLTCVAKNLTNEDIHVENNQKLEELAMTAFLEYCSKPMNKIKLTKGIKELIELKSNGDLASF